MEYLYEVIVQDLKLNGIFIKIQKKYCQQLEFRNTLNLLKRARIASQLKEDA